MQGQLQRPVEIPKNWYNVVPDLPQKLPPVLDPVARGPADIGHLNRLYLDVLAKQEYAPQRFIEIPEEVLEAYSIWRPTPLVRARRLEEVLNTPAKIYYKNESVSPSGSHKANAAIAQAYFAAKEGIERVVTSTTAGQWGTALAFACSIFGVKCTIFMSRSSYDSKPYRRSIAEAWGAEILPSPSERTEVGREILRNDPHSTGTMSIAKSEALEEVSNDPKARNAVGSIMNFVLASQTVVGQEAQRQMENVDEYPDTIIGCVGGGSNFSGILWPYYHDIVENKSGKEIDFIGAESTAAPKLTLGEYIYDHADIMRSSPLFKMYTVGHTFVPPPVHTGGLRVHGTAPTLSMLVHTGTVRGVAYDQLQAFEAGTMFARTEGILPAPETAHAIKAVIDEAKKAKEKSEEKVILFNLCGHGLLDVQAYNEFQEGKMRPDSADPNEIRRAIEQVKGLYPWLN
jgi:tryptophan synthase beta chain